MKRKAIVLMTAIALAIILSACGGDNPASGDNSDAEKIEEAEQMAYITDFDVNNIGVDAVEWVTIPSSRAEELGLLEEDGPSGFYIYNPDTLIEHFHLSADCIITVLDWQNAYEPLKVSTEEFFTILQERGEGNAYIPYLFVISNGEIVEISEHYVP